MKNSYLKSYLNDHLAASISALELLENTAACYAGTAAEPVARKLFQDVDADRATLAALMTQLGIAQSAPLKASAWFAEKMMQLKLRISDPASDALRLLQSTEALSVGVEGKRLLWRALATAAEQDPKLKGPDYETLIQRAEQQRSELETLRLDSAQKALTVV